MARPATGALHDTFEMSFTVPATWLDECGYWTLSVQLIEPTSFGWIRLARGVRFRWSFITRAVCTGRPGSGAGRVATGVPVAVTAALAVVLETSAPHSRTEVLTASALSARRERRFGMAHPWLEGSKALGLSRSLAVPHPVGVQPLSSRIFPN